MAIPPDGKSAGRCWREHKRFLVCTRERTPSLRNDQSHGRYRRRDGDCPQRRSRTFRHGVLGLGVVSLALGRPEENGASKENQKCIRQSKSSATWGETRSSAGVASESRSVHRAVRRHQAFLEERPRRVAGRTDWHGIVCQPPKTPPPQICIHHG